MKRSEQLPEYRKLNKEFLFRELAAPVKEETSLIEEYELSVRINQERSLHFICSPSYLTELVIGDLIAEGYIHSFADIKKLDLDEAGHRAEVLLKTGPGRNFTELPGGDAMPAAQEQLQKVPVLEWKGEWIWTLDNRFRMDTYLHKLTHSAHACFLMRNGKIIFEAEDLGRHNAIDKAVGYAVRYGIRLSECILYTTGRMPADMVRKVIRAGIPVMVSKEYPTVQGLELAQRYGLTLIGSVKNDKMMAF